MPYRGTPVLRNQPGFETGANSRLVKKLITITGNNAIALSFGTEGECFFRRHPAMSWFSVRATCERLTAVGSESPSRS
jgi:hypothetical protein